MGGGPPKHAHPHEHMWPWYDWTWSGMFAFYDWNAIRRGRQVYSEVFAPCHGLEDMTYNHFETFMTKEEIKKLASMNQCMDFHPETGLLTERPSKPTDLLPAPYPSQAAAMAANNGAAPPDLRKIVLARHEMRGEHYIFALLTGYKWSEYMDIPPWISLRPGQFFNPYFNGCILAMPPPLSDGMLEYEDGTPATVSQMAKDVVCFLKWCAEPEREERHLLGYRAYATTLTLALLGIHWSNRQTNWRPMMRATFKYWK